MTPTEYLGQLAALIGAGRDEEALEFTARWSRVVLPTMTAEQFFRATSMAESAALFASMTETGGDRQPADSTQPSVTTRAQA